MLSGVLLSMFNQIRCNFDFRGKLVSSSSMFPITHLSMNRRRLPFSLNNLNYNQSFSITLLNQVRLRVLEYYAQEIIINILRDIGCREQREVDQNIPKQSIKYPAVCRFNC